MAKAVSAVILSLMAFTPQFVHAAEYSGQVIHIVDGDTFDMRVGSASLRIRFCGIDSPERGHTGYRRARAALTALISEKIVRCVQVGSGTTPCEGRSKPKNRNRIVAQCFLENVDIAAEMVRSRNACDWPKFSGGHYRLDPTTCINSK